MHDDMRSNTKIRVAAIFLFILWKQLAVAQAVFMVDGFAKEYYGKMEISDTTEVFSKGWIAIYDKKTDQRIIKVVSDELTFPLHNGKVVDNIKSFPYGEQSSIMYEDFNFDGNKDFAIMDGQNSCYHGPSYRIYLAADKGFSFNEAFTRLAQEHCGMFEVDHDQKKIYTMTKSGCCWHELSEFIVKNNKPFATKITFVDNYLPFEIITEQTWNGKTIVKKTTKTIDLDQEGIKLILSFIIPKNSKKVVLYNINDRTLNYALVRKDNTVEFDYPVESGYQHPDFEFDRTPDNRSVIFSNKNATYKIYDKPTKLGIEITVDGKIHHMSGSYETKTGGLDRLLNVQFDNVVYQH